MCEFPIEHRAHALGTDHQIAVAKVAVHQASVPGRGRTACGQFMKSQVEYRATDDVAAIGGAPLLDQISRRLPRQSWKLADIDGMDARQDLPAGMRQGGASARQRWLFDDTCTEGL